MGVGVYSLGREGVYAVAERGLLAKGMESRGEGGREGEGRGGGERRGRRTRAVVVAVVRNSCSRCAFVVGAWLGFVRRVGLIL